MPKSLYLTIPARKVVDFDFRAFADHVVNSSPVYSTRVLMRLAYKALDAIDAAADGIAEMPRDVGEMFQRATEEAPIPRLLVSPAGPDGKPIAGHEPTPIGARAYDAFFEAIEQMSDKSPADLLPVAAE